VRVSLIADVQLLCSVLPKFKVSVLLPSFFLVNTYRKSQQQDLTFTVSAKYVLTTYLTFVAVIIIVVIIMSIMH